MTEPLDRFIGQTIADRYELVDCLDSSSPHSMVYKALDKSDQTVKAVKLLLSYREERLASFLDFASRAKNQIKHPNLAALLDFGTLGQDGPFGSSVYLVFEMLRGRSLYHILNRQGRIDLQKALPLFVQLAQLCKHLHAAGINFIQLSPRRIIVEDSGKQLIPRLSDSGLTAYLSVQSVNLADSVGQFPESTLYLSPEQCSGQEADHLSDIYSLGCIMYECLVGLPPFLSKDAYEVSRMHLNDEPKPLRMSRDDLNFPIELDLTVLKALRKNPAQRQQHMQELLEDLELVGKELSQVKESLSEKSGRSSSVLGDLLEDLFGTDSTARVKLGVPIVLGLTIVFGSIAVGTILNSANFKSPDAGSKAERDWQQLDTQAQRDLEHGNVASAEDRYLQALSLAENFGKRDRRLLATLRKLQDVYFTQKRFEKADDIESRIKSIMEDESSQ